MIEKVDKNDIEQCKNVIRSSFLTVAGEFGFTAENAPRFTAFATTAERLIWQLEQEKRLMFKYRTDNKIVGYYSLYRQNETECELNNLCVLEEYRHRGIGERLLLHSFEQAKIMGCKKINIGIVEENIKLRKWYEDFGFYHMGTEKFNFFPFTCGYMTKNV
ncbi:MAG: GNAT family N-acetyltransferase [Ruminococcaceae bacterium]|nr:GNAT family N-acetyltransferase [Oscillospiraceae bacterium]